MAANLLKTQHSKFVYLEWDLTMMQTSSSLISAFLYINISLVPEAVKGLQNNNFLKCTVCLF